jgi:hypothetical protein
MLLLVVAVVSALAGPSDTFVVYPISADPCLNPSTAKSSAVVSGVTTTTSLVVASTAAKSIYVCNLATYQTSTTAYATSFKLVSGTTTTYPCDTGQVQLSGDIGSSAVGGTTLNQGFGGTLFKAASGKNLCTTQTGTGSTLTGTITYIKQ